MQCRRLNDEARITHRNGVCHVQFIASVLAGERWEIRLRNVELHQRKLQQPLSSAVDDVPRLRPPGFGWRELERGARKQESVGADGGHQHVDSCRRRNPTASNLPSRTDIDTMWFSSGPKAIEAGLTGQFVRGQGHGRWWRRWCSAARRRSAPGVVRERRRGRYRPRHSSSRLG